MTPVVKLSPLSGVPMKPSRDPLPRSADPTGKKRQPSIRPRPVVLMYHAFTNRRRDDDPYKLFVTEGALRDQIRYLRDHRWATLNLDQYLLALDGGPRLRRSVLFTADDGYASFVTIAAPLLAASAIPSLLFVAPDLVGLRSSWMPELPNEPIADITMLRDLAAFNVEVGVHGWDHTAMVAMSERELLRHTTEARERVAEMTGYLPRAFAYPYGAFDEPARRAVQAAGFQVGFSVFRHAGRYAISRVDVNARDTARSFRVKLLPGYRRMWHAIGSVPQVRGRVGRLIHRQ
jgi:peptidoglycan/xylan/chitin deacetylase (PgdA/CDA1 family)